MICRLLFLAAVSSGLVACGGGGGGNGDTPNRAPTIAGLAHTVSEDTDLIAAVTTTDPEGAAVTLTRTSNPANGQVTRFEANGAFTYRANSDFSGTDSFGVRAADPAGNQVNATITITVTAVNDAPRGTATALQTQEDTPTAGQVAATDPENDAITFAKVADGARGTVTVAANGTFTYAPALNANGADTFEVEVRDTANAMSRITVNVTIQAVNDAPEIRNDFLRVVGGSPVVVDVLANDLEPDGDALTLTIVPNTLYFGQSATVSNGRIEVTMRPGFVGYSRIDYRAVDATGLGGTATAVFFVDTQPFRVVYESNEENGTLNAYVHDLVTARRVSNFDATSSPLFLGRTEVSANGRMIFYEAGISGVNNAYLAQEIWVARADGSAPARRITPPLQAGERLNARSNLSPDGDWMVYGITAASGAESLFLADLRPGGSSTPMPRPTGATKIESDFRALRFGPTSQFVYYAATFPFGAQTGQATYRVAVSNPAAPVRLSVPAAQGRFATVQLISPDEGRVILATFAVGVSTLGRIDTAQPGVVTTLSQVLGAGESLFDAVLADPAFARVAYMVQRPTNPATYGLYVAQVAQAQSGTHVADLATFGTPPHMTAMHPSGDAVLYTTSVDNAGPQQSINEIALTPGAAPLRVALRPFDLPIVDYVSNAEFIAYKGFSGLVQEQRRGEQFGFTTIGTRRSSFHTFSPDSNVLAMLGTAVAASDFQVFLANRVLFQELQFTGLLNPLSQVLSIALPPRE